MTRRPPAVLLVVGAAVLVSAAAWWLADNPPRDDSVASAQQIAPEEPTLPPQTDREIIEHPPSSTVEPSALDHDTGDGGFRKQDLWAHISDPANSDLPPELFAELSQLGADIVRADATGQGRDRWPDYWATADQQGGRAEPCCTDITIHATGAFAYPSGPSPVQVTVIWTGNHPQGALTESVTYLRLRRSGTRWHPE